MSLPLLFVIASLIQAPPAAQAPAAMSYEAFCQKEETERRQLFRAAAPELKAILARTQIERWRDVNEARLSAEQLDVIKELLSVSTSETFALSRPDQRLKLKEVEARAGAAFRGRELDEMGPGGPCIAKKPAK